MLYNKNYIIGCKSDLVNPYLAHKEQEPIFITKNGYSDLVVMSSELYDKFAKINPKAIRELDSIYEYIAKEKMAPENAKGQIDRMKTASEVCAAFFIAANMRSDPPSYPSCPAETTPQSGRTKRRRHRRRSRRRAYPAVGQSRTGLK